ncbi:Cytoskeleton associated protein 5 [Rhizoclosmatium sp. JEL0117]|nr:Cytoskeleton associated protein 5 [Rhizoclosmatium sp. JEL0117]
MNRSGGDGRINVCGEQLRELSFSYPLRLMSPSSRSKHRDVYMLSHGGGLVGGDEVKLQVVVEGGGSLSLLTQGSTKVFKQSESNPKPTRSIVQAHIHPSSLLSIIPDQVTPFADSVFESTQTILLNPVEASLILLDWFSSGRIHMNESFKFKSYESRVALLVPCVCASKTRNKELLRDAWLLKGAEAERDAFGYTCFGSLILMGPKVKTIIDNAVSQFESIWIGISAKQKVDTDLSWSLSRIFRRDLCPCLGVSGGGEELVGVVIRFCAVESLLAQTLLSRLLKAPFFLSLSLIYIVFQSKKLCRMAEEDFTSLPLSERLVHKSWKARVSGFDELTSKFKVLDESKTGEFRDWADYLKKGVVDSNAAAMEAALAATLSLAEFGPVSVVTRTRSTLIPLIVEKCLAHTKTTTRQKSVDIILMFVELENKADAVLEDVIPGLDHKTPKNVAACVSALKEMLRNFGSKVVPVKPLLKQLAKLFDHKDGTVRTEATNLALELYRWLGPAILPSLNDLKPVQLKDLNDQFEQYSATNAGKAVPERLVRSEMEKRQAVGYVAEEESSAGPQTQAAPEPVDVFDISDPVNILDKLPPKFYETLQAPKWSERKEILEALLVLVKVPKLEDGRYGELVNVLAKKINDAHVMVLTLAINCLEHIARGLRSNFSQYRGIVITPLLEKLKEKKTSVIEAIRTCLDALFLTLSSLTDVLEDVQTFLKHKNPQVKQETMLWLLRCLQNLRKVPAKGDIKNLAELMVKLLDDADSGVREAAAEGLGTLMRVVGERGMAAYMEKVEAGKAVKVKEFYEKAVVRVGGAAPPAKKEVPVVKAASPLPVKSAPLARPATSKPAPAKKPASAPTSAGSTSTSNTASASASSKKKSATKDDEPLSFKYSDDSAEAWISTQYPSLDLKEFSDANWKTRLAACHAFLETVKSGAAADVEAEAVIRWFGKSPGWKESNFQVMTAMVALFDHLAKECKASKGALSLVLSAMAEKLGDAKLKKVTGDLFTTFAEQYSLQFVLSQMYEPVGKAKSPKTLADALLWIHQSVMEFGIKGLDIKTLVEFVKVNGITNTNASVRSNAVILLGGLRMFVGPDIRQFVADLSGPQLATIDAEFEKVAARAPPAPSRVVQDAGPSTSEDPMDNLFPRVDIMTRVSPELLDKLSHAQWGLRKEGLEELAAIIESAKRFKPNLGEVPSALKARLNDSNRNLGIMAVEICGNLAVAVGKPFSKYAGVLIQPMASLLGDQKPHVRAAALSALENVHTACGIDCFVSPSSAALVADQPNLRKDLLKFLGEKLDLAKKSEGGVVMPKCEELLKPLLICLQDKNSDVRKYAAVVLVFVAEDVGVQYIQDRAADWYTGSALASLKPFFIPLQDVGGGKSGAPGSPKPAVAKKMPVDSAGGSKLKAPSSAASSAGVAKKRPVSMAAAPAVAKAVEPAATGSAPVLTSDPRGKETRASQDRGMTKWTFEAPRKDLVDFLNDQCNGNLSEPVIALLFSTDHYKEKDFLQGLTLIDEAIQTADADMKARFVANTDLILKYLTIRFFDTNTTMLMKVLELLEHLFTLLDEEGVALSEYEASSFLPFFIVKVGDNKETMRVKIRGIFKQLCKIYPPSKLFTYILAALTSKNSRVRTECLEELGDLIKKNGMSVCVPAKVLPVIAAQIADSDAKVRNAALGTVTQAYLLMGDAVYKQLGRISEKDKSLLEEKVKRLPPPTLAKEPVPAAAPASSSPLFKKRLPIPSETSSDSGNSTSASVSGLVGIPKPSSTGVKKEFSLDLDKINQVGSKSSAVNNQPEPIAMDVDDSPMLDYLVTQITAGDAYQSIDALKQIEKVITGPVEQVLPYINEIISAVTLQIRIAFSAADLSSAGTTRLCKHLVNVLVQIFSNPQIARSIQRLPLHQCVQELLNRLLDPGLQSVDQGAQLSKALNVLMVRVLDNTDRNLSFGILLNLLEQSATSSVHCSPEELPLQAKYTELVMKCLWKLTKVIPQLIQEKQLDAGQLILGVHEFLRVSPPNEWKRRAAEKVVPQADMPLRTVKTILHELCNCLGEKALDCTALIEDPSRSHAVGYMRQMLGQPAAAASTSNESKIANLPSRQAAASPTSADFDQRLSALKRSMTMPVRESSDRISTLETSEVKPAEKPVPVIRRASTGPLSEVEADAQLTIIFARISAKEETKQGIADLYQFRKQHPDCDVYVNQHLSKTGNYFQGYIKRGLSALEAEERSERAASVSHTSNTEGSTDVSQSTEFPAKRILTASLTWLHIIEQKMDDSEERTMFGGGGGAAALSHSLSRNKNGKPESIALKQNTPQQASNVQGNQVHGNTAGSLKLSELMGTNRPPPTYANESDPEDTKPHGNAIGSVKLSELYSTSKNVVENEDSHVHGDGIGSLKMSAVMGTNKLPPTYANGNEVAVAQVHGDGIGSLKLSAAIGSNQPPPTYAHGNNTAVEKVYGDGIGSLKLSEALGTNKQPPTYASANVPTDSEPIELHGNGIGSLKLSAAMGSGKSSSSPANGTEVDESVGYGQGISSIKLSEAMGQKSQVTSSQKQSSKIADTTPIEDILKSLAIDNEWTPDELAEDTAKFKKYRIKNARQARDLSLKAWDEMTDLLPVTKDVVRTAIGWSQH